MFEIIHVPRTKTPLFRKEKLNWQLKRIVNNIQILK